MLTSQLVCNAKTIGQFENSDAVLGSEGYLHEQATMRDDPQALRNEAQRAILRAISEGVTLGLARLAESIHQGSGNDSLLLVELESKAMFRSLLTLNEYQAPGSIGAKIQRGVTAIVNGMIDDLVTDLAAEQTGHRCETTEAISGHRKAKAFERSERRAGHLELYNEALANGAPAERIAELRLLVDSVGA